jgi:S-phase kinase-associated protein 1
MNEHIKPHVSDDDLRAFDQEFVSVDDDLLFNLILAANYLDMKVLLDATCMAVAEQIKKCKSPAELRGRFNITGDFTPEEEDDVRRQYSWIDRQE